jgi:hypothetical protein
VRPTTVANSPLRGSTGFYWIDIFGRVLPENKLLIPGRLPENKLLFPGSLPENKLLFPGSLPENKLLFPKSLSENNLFQNLYLVYMRCILRGIFGLHFILF